MAPGDLDACGGALNANPISLQKTKEKEALLVFYNHTAHAKTQAITYVRQEALHLRLHETRTSIPPVGDWLKWKAPSVPPAGDWFSWAAHRIPPVTD